jgi:ArsR family transcriptional regulator
MKHLQRTFKALSEETRLQIMALVFRHGHLCPCEVEQLLGITQSKASRHLRYLRDAGLLEDRREGLIVNYHLSGDPDPDTKAVLDFLAALVDGREVAPQATPLLVQIRTARTMGEAASSVGAAE